MGSAVDLFNNVSAQLMLHVLLMGGDHLVESRHHAGDFELGLYFSVYFKTRTYLDGLVLGATFLELMKGKCTFTQRLAGNGATLHAGAADVTCLFDDQDALICLGPLNGGFLSGWTATDDDNIVVRNRLHQDIASTTVCILSRFSIRFATSSG